jgi:N-acetylglucosaminyldiphosphoundecaprenol N-acetyl-beta-D-mannosaminyltransferase
MPTQHSTNSREIYYLCGLPVDNLNMSQTKALLRKVVREGKQVVLSTINVNWMVESLRSPDFRKSILNSDIVVIDGKPLLWLSKLRGYPMTEVVPGSSLIQDLHKEKASGNPLTIFMFGGENDVAQRAMERINANSGGLEAVGAMNPGFGSINEMSTRDIISSINQAHPDILLVALGAKKGMQWIDHNRHRLDARIISHLGATINFLAGTVQRAPIWMQKLGVEWLWRVWQEPKLFIRYAKDGQVFLRLLLTGAY